MHEEFSDIRIGFFCWNNLKQIQIAGRIEKMCAQKMLLKVFTSSIQHQVDRDTRCIGCNKCARSAVFFNLVKHFLFDVEIFNHHFNDPVSIFNILHVITEIPGADTACKIRMIQRRRLAFDSGIE